MRPVAVHDEGTDVLCVGRFLVDFSYSGCSDCCSVSESSRQETRTARRIRFFPTVILLGGDTTLTVVVDQSVLLLTLIEIGDHLLKSSSCICSQNLTWMPATDS